MRLRRIIYVVVVLAISIVLAVAIILLLAGYDSASVNGAATPASPQTLLT